jgi:hypothetical protein
MRGIKGLVYETSLLDADEVKRKAKSLQREFVSVALPSKTVKINFQKHQVVASPFQKVFSGFY